MYGCVPSNTSEIQVIMLLEVAMIATPPLLSVISTGGVRENLWEWLWEWVGIAISVSFNCHSLDMLAQTVLRQRMLGLRAHTYTHTHTSWVTNAMSYFGPLVLVIALVNMHYLVLNIHVCHTLEWNIAIPPVTDIMFYVIIFVNNRCRELMYDTWVALIVFNLRHVNTPSVGWIHTLHF
jgi:hypothetical protein